MGSFSASDVESLQSEVVFERPDELVFDVLAHEAFEFFEIDRPAAVCVEFFPERLDVLLRRLLLLPEFLQVHLEKLFDFVFVE